MEFTRYTFPQYRTNWHHDILCSHLDRFVSGEIKRLMVFMPPRHGKSELVSRRLPAYLLGKNPDANIIACSYSADLASRMNRDVQRIIDTPEYHSVFPETTLYGGNVRTDIIGRPLRNSDLFEVVGHKGMYRGAGMGGGITGMGANYAIIDDPIKNAEEADSEVYRESQWEWYTTTFLTRLEQGAGLLVTLTRWHEDDIAGRLLKLAKDDPKADQWTVVRFPAIADGTGYPEDEREEGEPLWEWKRTLDELGKIKAALGSYRFSALFQQAPSPAEGGTIKREWLTSHYYTVLPKSFQRVMQSWDCAFKGTEESDYVVGQVWGKDGADYYLLDQVRARMDFPSTVAAITSLSAKWPQAREKCVEDKANGPAVIDTLRKKLSGLIAVNPEGGKEARASAVSPLLEAGNVHLPDPSLASWVHDFVEECAAFPKGANDDQVDAMSQALLRMSKGQSLNVVPISVTKEALRFS